MRSPNDVCGHYAARGVVEASTHQGSCVPCSTSMGAVSCFITPRMLVLVSIRDIAAPVSARERSGVSSARRVGVKLRKQTRTGAQATHMYGCHGVQTHTLACVRLLTAGAAGSHAGLKIDFTSSASTKSRFKYTCGWGGRGGADGKYRSSVNAREPQNPTKSEEYQRHV
eukprot:782583-Prorocentrum_minimum.AAC.2